MNTKILYQMRGYECPIIVEKYIEHALYMERDTSHDGKATHAKIRQAPTIL